MPGGLRGGAGCTSWVTVARWSAVKGRHTMVRSLMRGGLVLTLVAVLLPAITTRSAAVADPPTLMVSKSATRAEAVPLGGASVTDAVYIFVAPEEGVSLVSFRLDDSARENPPRVVERAAPFDFVGTKSDLTAKPFDTSTLTNGTHVVSAAVERADGTTQHVDATFTVSNTTTPTEYSLAVSTSPHRADSVPLQGADLQDTAYIFLAPDAGVRQVDYRLDDPDASQPPRTVERVAPWDFGGTNQDLSAVPFDTTREADGSHTITARVKLSDGEVQTVSADFTISNGAPALLFTPETMELQTGVGGGPLTRTVTVETNTGDSSPVTLSSSAAWLEPSSGTAATGTPFDIVVDPTGLPAGEHRAQLTANADGYLSGTFEVLLVVGDPAPVFELLAADTPDRADPGPLDGRTVQGALYVFADGDPEGVSRVRFYLDDTDMSGKALLTEKVTPFDFAGTAPDMTAKPFDTTTLADGQHAVTAAIDRVDGSTTVVHSTFTVANAASDDPVAPGSLTAVGGDGLVSLGWDASVSNDVAGYDVYRSSTSPVDTSGTPLNGVDLVTGTTFEDRAVVNGSTYHYAVVTELSDGRRSLPSAEASATPAPPGDVPAVDVKVNFQDAASAPPTGYQVDYGQAFGERTGPDQGTGLSYGWVVPGTDQPADLVGLGRNRSDDSVTDPRLRTFMHMQSESQHGNWELATPNGAYVVTVGVGDPSYLDSTHWISIENQNAVAEFVPTSGERFATVSRTVWVADGRLTLDATQGTNTKISYVTVTSLDDSTRPRLSQVHPLNLETGVATNTSVTADLSLTSGGIDNSTLSSQAVQLTDVGSGEQVPGTVNTSGGGDVVVLVPQQPLDPGKFYRFDVTEAVKDVNGNSFLPWSSVFKAGASSSGEPLDGVAFEKVAAGASGASFTSVAIGPDNRLYAGTLFGEIWRYDIASDGTLTNPLAITSAKEDGRTIIGLAFDPASTAEAPILWVTSNVPYLGEANVPDWTGKIVRLSGPDLANAQEMVVGLPRSIRDHESNSLAFGPDGALYLTQGSNTAMGAPDGAWGNRPERMLSAAVLRIDTAALADIDGLPLDVQTESSGSYDPFAQDAPVSLYATGVRNAYDLVWHTNGELYVPTNGSAAGGNTPGTPDPLPASCARRIDASEAGAYTGPTVPAITKNQQTEPDWVFRVEAGGYYGHPAPARCEWVLNGGNPTSGSDTHQVSAYPVGTQPDRNYREGGVYNVGAHASANGAIEYQGDAFGGALQGKLLVVRYSVGDDIIVLDPSGANGNITAKYVGTVGMTGFNDPLDITEDTRSGNLYVTELGGRRITLLRPVTESSGGAAKVAPGELVFDAVQGTVTTAQSVSVENTGAEPVVISSAEVSGANAGAFRTADGAPVLPVEVAPGESVEIPVEFAPPTGTVGALTAGMDITTSSALTPTLSVELYGLSTKGLEGSNEPPLQQVVDTLGHAIDVGGTTLSLGTGADPIGDEVSAPLFEKAGSGDVAMTPIARYSPDGTVDFGYYKVDNGVVQQTQVETIAAGEFQTLYPATIGSGGTAFDPGSGAFGLFSKPSSVNRSIYTEDARNTGAVDHAVRTYPARDRDGNPIAHAYVVGFEEATNGDYQDYLYLLTNVRPTDGGNEEPSPPPPTNGFEWTTRAPAPTPRSESNGVVHEGKVYTFGGFFDGSYDVTGRSDAYDVSSDTWTRLADMPEPSTHAPAVVVGDTIWLIGGYVGDHPGGATTHVWKYDISADSWSRGPDLPAPRGAGGAAVVGGKIHFVGGTNRVAGAHNDPDQSDHYILDTSGTGPWTTGPALPNPRNHMGATAIGDKIYVVGGQHRHEEGTSNQTQVDVFDTSEGQWSRAADMPVGRGHISASTFATDGRIFVVGGAENGGAGVPSSRVASYDPATDTWAELPSLPAGRKTPVAGAVGDVLVSATGNGPSGATTTTWSALSRDVWETGSNAPLALGEVAGGGIGRKLYLVGEGGSATLAYDVGTRTWQTGLAPRPFVGHHHAAEVIGGKLYLFGGLGSNSAGKVQIYDPATDSWSLGTDMPFAAGSSSSAVIDGLVYVAGGIVGSTTTKQAAVYDPVSDSWQSIPEMKQGRNHAAAATDGERLYVFGGRGPGSGDGNVVANGFDTVQIYDPATEVWTSSLDAGSTIRPLPQARGGMGKAVFLDGEFYVMGGETSTGAGADPNGVYNRVDVYDPATNQWRLASSMPTAKHGIFPMLRNGRIYVALGGTRAGHSASRGVEVYSAG